MDFEHPNYKKYLEKEKFTKIIAVDFDNTIHEYLSQNQDWTLILDSPVKGAKEALEKLKLNGWFIIIHSARVIDKKTYKAVKDWLDKYQIYYDEIYYEKSKPFAHIYIDDRALTFRGDWIQTLEEISNFKTYLENEKC